MTRLRWSVIATAVVALLLSTATPAAATALSYTVSPASGTAGSTVTVSGSDPCPAPPTGDTFLGVSVIMIDHPLQTVIAIDDVPVASGASWTTDIQIAQSARNGDYHVLVFCVADENGDVAPYDVYEPLKSFAVTSPAGQSDPVVRIAGTDRIGTAIAASQDIYKTSNLLDGLVLSRADSYADALAGTPLADGEDAPLLLTPTDQLDPRTEQEIKRVLKAGGEVTLLGGSAAIGDGVAAALAGDGFQIKRLAGVNRYDTATKIADEIATSTDLTTVLIANGNDFHDGLIAGAAALSAANPGGFDGATGSGGAVLLTNGETMAPETMSWLDAHGGVNRYAIGAVAAKAAPAALALAGSDYADTSRKVATQFYSSPVTVAFASSANFPDALTGGAHAAAFDAPLLFTDPTALPQTISDYLSGLKSSISIGFLYGGTAAISDDVRTAIVQAIT